MSCSRLGLPFILLCCLVAWHVPETSAVEAPLADDDVARQPIQRVFVPADQPETWPLGNVKYVPTSHDQWKQFIQQQSKPDAAGTTPPPEITRADYTLRLQSPDQLAGHAVLSVRLDPPRPTLVPLVPFTPRLTHLTASDSPGQPILGSWMRPSDSGAQLGVLLQQSSEIRFEFLARGVETGGGRRFPLGLPAGVRQTITVETTDDVEVQLDHALLQSRTNLADGGQRWVFLPGPSGRRELRILSAPEPSDGSVAEIRYSQEESYRLATHGLDYETTLTVRSTGEREAELELLASDDLKLLQATVDGLTAAWTGEAFGPSSRIVLPPTDQTHTVHLRGAARVVLEEPWELPAVRLRDAEWTEGVLTLWVDPRLELSALNPLDAQLSGLLPPGESATEGEVYRLQAWHVQSGVEVVARRPQQQMSVDVLHEVVLDDDVETVQTTLVFEGRRPNDFHAELSIAPGWQVESVDAAPTGEVLHWRVVEGNEVRRLQVQFRTPPTRQTPLVLKIAGERRDEPIDLPARAGDFTWLDVSSYRLKQHLLWLSGRQSDDRVAAASSTGALASSAAAGPDEGVAAHFRVAMPAASTVGIDLGSTPVDAAIDLERRKPTYEAESVVACAAARDAFAYQIELSCQPLQGAVRDLPVVFSRPLPASAQWSLGTQGAALAVTPLDAPLRDNAEEDQQPSVYRVYLPKPTSEPFRLTVAYQRPDAQVHAVDGVICPNAQQFHSWAVLLGDPRQTRAEGGDCGPAPLPASDATVIRRLPDELPILAAFRYDEDYPLRLGLAPQLIRQDHPATTPVERSIVCHWMERSSLHALEGQTRCRTSYYLTPRGQEGARFTFPTDVDDVDAWIDQTPAVVTPSTTSPREVNVLLPAGADSLELTLDFLAHAPALDEQSHVGDPWPTPSFSTPTGRWTVWTPPRYRVEAATPKSLSIVERLFGPLTRRPTQAPFRPWRREAWQMPGRLHAELQTPYRHAQQLLRRLDHRLLATPTGDRQQILKQALWSWLEDTAILVDPAALSLELPHDAGSEFPVALAVTPAAIIVTSPRQIAYGWKELDRTASERIYIRRNGAAESGVPWEGLIAAERWLQSGNAEAPLAEGTARMTPLGVEGWRATQLATVGRLSPPVLIAPARQKIIWKAYWLLAAVTGVWLSRTTPRRVGLSILALATLCLVTPPAWLVVPQAAWLGLTIGWLAARLSKWIASLAPPASQATTLAASLLLLLSAWGDDAAAADRWLPPTQVLVPIDARGEAVGDEIYVPAELLRKLQASQAIDPYDRESAVVTSGRWQLFLPSGDASWPPERSSLTIRGQTFRPGVVLTLPLEQADATWLDASHRLNGAPVSVDWLDPKGCRVPIGGAGNFELRLFFHPRIRESDGRRAIRMAIPQLPASELLLRGVEQVDEITVPEAVELSRDEKVGQATALLSATDQLALSWRGRALVSRRVRVEQLHWLSIRPAVSRLKTLIRLNGDGRAPAEVELKFSSDLALPESEQQDETSPVRIVAVENDRVVLEIQPGEQLPLEIPLEFQLKRTVSIGRIAMPRIEVAGMETVRSWFAASVDSRLNYEESSGAALRRVPVSEFSDRWGAPETQPATAWSVDDGPTNWSIRVWPRRSPVVAQQTLRLWRHLQQSTIEYAVDIAAPAQDALIYRFEIPPDFVVGEVAVAVDDQEQPVPVRWAVSEPGLLTLFLREPVATSHRIVLSGQQPAPAETRQRLPQFRLLDAELGPLKLILDRDRQVDVALSGIAPSPLEEPSPAPSPEFARVGVYRLDEAKSEGAILNVSSNRVQASAETVLRVVPETQPVEVEFWIALDVKRGRLDRLTLQAPEGLRNLSMADPSGATTSINQSTQRVECFLASAVTAGQRRVVRLRGQLASAADRRVRLPEIRLAAIEEKARYVVLPTTFDDRSLYWDWDNLYRRRLPPELAGAAAGNSVSFRVTGEHFTAEQKIRPPSLRRVLVRSAQVSALVDASREVVATSRYVLQPANVQHAHLRLPDKAELLSLEVGGRPVTTAGDSALLPIALSPPLMPIEIVARYRYQLPISGSWLTLTAPQLEIAGRDVPTPVRWEIVPAEGLQIVSVDKARRGDAKRIDLQTFLALGRQQRRESLEQASLLALQLPDWEARQWYDGWRAELAEGPEQQDTAAEQHQGGSTDDHWEMLNEQFGPPAKRPARDLRHDVTPASRDAAYLVTQGSTLKLQIASHVGPWTRWLLAGCLAGLVVAGRRYWQWPGRVADYLAHRTEIIALAAGFVWWYWLVPSSVGAAVVLIVAALLLKRTATRRWPASGEVAELTDSAFS